MGRMPRTARDPRTARTPAKEQRFRIRRSKRVPLVPGGGSGNCGRILHVRGSSVRPLGGVLCLLFFYGSLAAAVAQEDPVQAAHEGLVLIPQGTSARLELPGGGTLSLRLPERAEVSSLAATDGGWVAAGSFPDAAGRPRPFLLAGKGKRCPGAPP